MNQNHRVLQWGDHGDTLVFLHYFGGEARSWQWVTRELSSQFRCIALNLPGFGGASPLEQPSIQQLAHYVACELDALNVEKYTLIGHSMGAKIAVQVAVDDSNNRVQQLILLAPSPPGVEPMPARDKARMLHHPDCGEAQTSVARATHAQLPGDQHTLAVESQLRADPTVWQWWLLEGMSHSIATAASRLTLPISVLTSSDDPIITMDVIEQNVLPVLSVKNLVVTQAIGHLSPLEAPHWVALQIRTIAEDPPQPADEEPKIHYWNVWTDEDGISRQTRAVLQSFEPESMGGDAQPQWNMHLSHTNIHVLFSELPVGWQGTWHENPKPQWIIPLSGRWYVETMDGHRVEMGPGELSFGGDQHTKANAAGHKGHLSGTVGSQPARLMIIQLKHNSIEKGS